jgi:hypothetical protein
VVSLNEKDLRAVQFPAYFLCAVSKLESEVAQKIHVIALPDMPIPVVDQHLVMGLNIRKWSFGIANDIRMGEMRVRNEPCAFHSQIHRPVWTRARSSPALTASTPK